MLNFITVLGLPLLACVLLVGMLGFLGLHVLRREIIFIDIALAQVVAVGAIGAHLAFDAHADSLIGYASALGAALVMAVFYAFARRMAPQIPLEAVIGVSYAIAAAGALFLVGVAPGGHVHVGHMLSGSILWVTWKDILACAAVFALVGTCFFLLRQQMSGTVNHAGAHDQSRNTAQEPRPGLQIVFWDFVFYALVSLVITFSVRVAGVVLVFSFLIIPATASALFARSWRARMLIAWSVGALGSMAGLALADQLDLSVGPAVAGCLGLLLILAAIRNRLRPAG